MLIQTGPSGSPIEPSKHEWQALNVSECFSKGAFSFIFEQVKPGGEDGLHTQHCFLVHVND